MAAECSALPAARSALREVEEQIRVLEAETGPDRRAGLLPQLRERQLKLREEVAALERLCRPRFENAKARREKVEAWQETADARLEELSALRDSGELSKQDHRSERRRLHGKRHSYERELHKLRYRERYLELCLASSRALTARQLKKLARGESPETREKRDAASRRSPTRRKKAAADHTSPRGKQQAGEQHARRQRSGRQRRGLVVGGAAFLAALAAAGYLLYPAELTSFVLQAAMPPEAKRQAVAEAVARAGSGELSSAAADLERVLRAYPKDSAAAFELVSVYVLEGRIKEATALCRAVLEREPDNREAAQWLALLEANAE